MVSVDYQISQSKYAEIIYLIILLFRSVIFIIIVAIIFHSSSKSICITIILVIVIIITIIIINATILAIRCLLQNFKRKTFSLVNSLTSAVH